MSDSLAEKVLDFNQNYKSLVASSVGIFSARLCPLMHLSADGYYR